MSDADFDPPSDLPGEVRVDASSQHADYFTRGVETVRITHDLGARKYAAWVPVTPELMADGAAMRSLMDHTVDRHLRPWNYPDRYRWPEFVPLPRVAAFVTSMRARRQRVRDAWSVLRGRDRLYDPDRDDDW